MYWVCFKLPPSELWWRPQLLVADVCGAAETSTRIRLLMIHYLTIGPLLYRSFVFVFLLLLNLSWFPVSAYKTVLRRPGAVRPTSGRLGMSAWWVMALMTNDCRTPADFFDGWLNLETTATRLDFDSDPGQSLIRLMDVPWREIASSS